jgi:sortase (surface protein transpeptidase)
VRPGRPQSNSRRTAPITTPVVHRPIRLAIPSLSLNAPIRPVGVNGDGAVAIPADVDTVGWYRWGASPGSTAGSTVIVGHVDSATQGTGAFFRLSKLTSGAAVLVTTDDGQIRRYRVVGRQQYPKTVVPLADIFSARGVPRLTLVTCGGRFDRSERSYRDNIVVTAVPE